MKRDLPEIPDIVDYWLTEWARWCRRDDAELWYPGIAKPFIGGGESQRTEDWEEGEREKIHARNCEAMNALMDDLSKAYPVTCAAVRCIYLGEPWVWRPHEPTYYLEQAIWFLQPRMNAKAIL